MKRKEIEATKGVRILFGVVGVAMLYALIDGLLTGEFNMHGERYLRADHPIGFYANATFLALLGIAGLSVAAFGKVRTPSN